MAFLHYRDAAFQIQRAEQVGGQTIAWDMMLSFACSSDDPISGGRHKVLGSKALNIPPQTSTIASHLPKAVGAAFSLGLAARNPPEHRQLAADSLIYCSFGDASANHSTAQGAFNTASWTSYQNLPLPILFVCEDNGIGISTKTPQGWIKASFEGRPALRYFACDALDIYETYRVVAEASHFVRTRRRPAFIHAKTIRLYGHAGADVPTAYLSRAEVEAEEARDPLLNMVRQLEAAGALKTSTALKIYNDTMERVERIADQVIHRPKLVTAADVMSTVIPPRRPSCDVPVPSAAERELAFGSDWPSMKEPQIMSRLIGWALTDLMLQHGEIALMGEDVGRKGGVYGATQKIHSRFGPSRVIDTLLDEQSILLGSSNRGS